MHQSKRQHKKKKKFVCVCEVNLFSFAEAGVVLGWEQSTGLLYATGDVRYIRVWDTHKEMKIQVDYYY